MDLIEVDCFSLAINSCLQPATASDIQTSAPTIWTLMRSTYHWIFMVITRAVVFVKIAGTTLKASIATVANPSSIGHGTSHSMQPTYVNVSSSKT